MSHHIIRIFFAVALLSAATAAGAADSGSALIRLQHFLHDVTTLKADFTQTVLDAELKTQKESSGTLAIKRPNRFRWDYTKPFAQLIIADGQKLWIYDEELDQVTVKPLGQSLASSPAVLLSGTGSLQDNFDITELPPADGLQWLELVPKVKDTDFDKIRIGLDQTTVRVMELTDNLGQTTRITFHDEQLNPAVPDSAFSFTPPADADVIGEDGATTR